jgi:hypothetical protein
MPNKRYEELFKENTIMTMERLMLETGRPKESILRDLRGIGYYSSYNARGKFYTLSGTPDFDSLGLWNYRNAHFSARRTLLDTAEYLIGASDAGRTHDELRRILGVGLQNSLFQLATENRVARRQVGPQYVYFGVENIGEQWERRSAMPIEPITRKKPEAPEAKGHPNMEPALVIDILVAVLRGHETESAAHGYVRRAGSKITASQVAAVFRHYAIGKKNSAPRR